jgi:hypothetical protein
MIQPFLVFLQIKDALSWFLKFGFIVDFVCYQSLEHVEAYGFNEKYLELSYSIGEVIKCEGVAVAVVVTIVFQMIIIVGESNI